MSNNVTFPTENISVLTEVIPVASIQQLHSSEQRWEGNRAEVWEMSAPKEPVCMQFDCDVIAVHLHNTVNLQRQVSTHRERGISYKGGICLETKGQVTSYSWQEMPVVLLQLFLEPCLVQQIVAEMGRNDPIHIEMISQFNIHDPLIEQIGFSLVGELESGGIGGRIYASLPDRNFVLKCKSVN